MPFAASSEKSSRRWTVRSIAGKGRERRVRNRAAGRVQQGVPLLQRAMSLSIAAIRLLVSFLDLERVIHLIHLAAFRCE